MLENGVRQRRGRVAGLCCVLELARSARPAAEPLDTGVEVKGVVERVDPDAPLPQQVQHRAGVDRPGARVHRNALEWAEPHRRVHRAAVYHRGDGAAAAEVTDDDAKPGPAEERGGALDTPLDGKAVKAVAAYSELLAPTSRDRIDGGLFRNRLVEGRVEDSDVRKVWEGFLGLGDRPERRRVVERGERLECENLPANLLVDQHRLPEPWTPVDDAVCYGVELVLAGLLE